MKIIVVLSDISCPPSEGLHQQSLLFLSHLGHAADIKVYSFCRSTKNFDEQALFERFGIRLAREALKDSLPSVVRGLVSRLPTALQRKDIQEIIHDIESNEAVPVYLEGAAAAGLVRRSFGWRTLINIVDPPSLRQRRLSRNTSHQLSKFLKHLLGYIFASMLEFSINYRNISWNVVSRSDRDYLVNRLKTTQVSAISVILPDEISTKDFEPVFMEDDVRVIFYADLRVEHMNTAFKLAIQGVSRLPGPILKRFRFSVLGRVNSVDVGVKLPPQLNIEFVPFVDDYISFLRSADIVVLPDGVGTGIKNRVVQAMALGRAVVATQAAVEGTLVVDGLHALVVDAPGKVADGLLRLLNDRDLGRKIAVEGGKLMIDNHHAEVVIRAWMREFERVLGKK